MTSLGKWSLALAIAAVFGVLAISQPPGDRGPGDGPPGQDPQGRGPNGGPPRGFQLGWVLPPHIREQIELTPEQEKQIAEIEKEVKSRLEKILTDKQKEKIQQTGPPGGGAGGGPGGQRGPWRSERRTAWRWRRRATRRRPGRGRRS
jgi:hypothetical protein